MGESALAQDGRGVGKTGDRRGAKEAEHGWGAGWHSIGKQKCSSFVSLCRLVCNATRNTSGGRGGGMA